MTPAANVNSGVPVAGLATPLLRSGITRAFSARPVCARIGSATGRACMPGRPSTGTSRGGQTRASVSRVVRARIGSPTGRAWVFQVPPAGVSSAAPYAASPVRMRCSVLGLSGSARSPMRRPGTVQSMRVAAGSADGATTPPRQVVCGQR
ncbi:MAG TPA: hypothetical protein VGQ26_23415 [Streptosporangiaceae bacterium]|nr:hypothetical protein [Streptosporangiaceae bacterium]